MLSHVQLLQCHQSLSRVQLFATPWTAARQASLSFIISRSLLKLKSMESVMPSNHLVLYHPLLPLPSFFPSLRVFSTEVALRVRWPKTFNSTPYNFRVSLVEKYRSISFSISPSNEYSGPISFRMDGLNLQSKGLSRIFSNTTVQKHQFFGIQPSL